MSLEVTGKLYMKYDTQQIKESFRKREFVLELADEINGNVYTNYAKFQLVQNKCDVLDRFNEGDMVKVNFNIKGNRWEKDGRVNFITNLDAWRIESAAMATGNSNVAQPAGNNYSNNAAANSNSNYNGNNFYNPSPENVDDLPF